MADTPAATRSFALSREEQFVKDVLEDKVARVDPIARSGDRTPDFGMQLMGCRYVIEVKTREEDEARVDARNESLRSGEIHGDSEERRRKNTISGIIDWGVDQLMGYGPPEAFRILWVHCGGSFSERYKHQFFNAFYGSTRLYDLDDTEFKVDGLYFRDSDFFRYRTSIDGAVITMELGEEVRLFCLCNDCSPNYEAFRVSPLTQVFPVGLYDPLTQEAAGEAIVVRGNFDRRKVDDVLGYLYKRTGRRIYNMDFTHATAMLTVPRGIVS